MTKSAKRSIIVSAVLAIIVCVSIVAGATFALFTSESKVNIAVTSGKVDVVASISDFETKSPEKITSEGEVVDESYASGFTNGGEGTQSGNEITLKNITPGDKAIFNITVKNNSTVKVKYRTKILLTADDGLYGALNMKIGSYTGTAITKWEDLAVGNDGTTLPCEIELPTTAGNYYQGKTVKFSVIVEAVQSNTETKDAITAAELKTKYGDDGLSMPKGLNLSVTKQDGVIITLNDEEAFVYFTQVFDRVKARAARETALTNGTLTKYEGEVDNYHNIWYYLTYKVKLNCNVDLQNQIVKPFTTYNSFDGQNNAIKNAWVYGDGNVGFFGAAAVTKVTLDNIHVIANGKDAAGIVSGFNNGTITYVTVKNSSVVGGKFAGAIVGNCYADINNCAVENCSVTGQYKVGGLAGYVCSEGTRKIQNNTLKNVTIKGDNLWSGKKDFVIGKVVGNWNSLSSGDVCKDNTLTNVTGATDNIGELEGSVGVVDQGD